MTKTLFSLAAKELGLNPTVQTPRDFLVTRYSAPLSTDSRVVSGNIQDEPDCDKELGANRSPALIPIGPPL